MMRTTTLPAIFDKLPSVLKAIICEVSKKASAGNQSTDVIISADKLFLFSEVEVDGTTNAVYKDEGTKYPIFASNTNRKKNLANGTGSVSSWWLRSPYTGGTVNFRHVISNGLVGNYGASFSNGVAFGFCI